MSDPPESYNIDNICQQIRRRGLLNVPPPRNTPVSPYPQYSKFQLDMRRKAEILQYRANATNTKTNNLTKAQLFSLLVNGKLQQYNPSTLADISNGRINCNEMVKTPTSSSNVPGPVIDLYLDPSVPLYQYNKNTESYGIINSVDDSLWTTYTTNDILIGENVITEYFTLYIHNNITQNYYTYQFETPLSIFLQGGAYVVSPINPIPATTPITCVIENIYVYVYFNDTLVTSNDPNVSGTIANIPIVSHDFTPLSLKVINPELDFSTVFYSGNLQVSNLLLFTQPGFVYDVKLRIGMSITDNDFSNIRLRNYGNVSAYNNNSVNCELLTPPSQDTNSGFVFK